MNLERARAWDLPLERIRTPFDDPLADIRLDIEEHRKAIKAVAQQPDVKAIVLDSIRGTHRGKENDSEVIAVVLSWRSWPVTQASLLSLCCIFASQTKAIRRAG